MFFLDGTAVDVEDTVEPYSITWDTTLATNGLHALTAVARDAAGNVATSNPSAVTIAEPATTTCSSANGRVEPAGGLGSG